MDRLTVDLSFGSRSPSGVSYRASGWQAWTFLVAPLTLKVAEKSLSYINLVFAHLLFFPCRMLIELTAVG
jgi:hypothetical protein